MPDPADNETLLCGSCGAVWVVAPLLDGAARSEDCLECGGHLAADGPETGHAEDDE